MFLKYLAPLYEPIRWIRTRWVGAQTAVGRVRVDVNRAKSYKNIAKSKPAEAKRRLKQAKQQAKDAKLRAKQKAASLRARRGGAAGALPPGAPGGYPALPPGPQGAAPGGYGGPPAPGGYGGPPAPGGYGGPPVPGGYGGAPAPGAYSGGRAPGAVVPAGGMSPQGPAYLAATAGPGYAPASQPGPEASASVSGSTGIVVTGALWWKKHLCENCGQRLDKTWDRCPYCAPQAPVDVAPPLAPKTQAIMLDPAGMGSGNQLIGWLVPVKGPQRGELYTLAPVSEIGTDAGCTVVLLDQYMSAKHAEIRIEAGMWVLHDLRSTNGTYVNDKRVERHELVDSDFIRFGQSLVKFKCL